MKNLIKQINWQRGNGLVPAIVQDDTSGTVLMLGYMNRQSLTKTLKSKKVWFYSRSKKRLWMKGETSGNILKLVTIKIDCDSDALLAKVNAAGPTCHTSNYSCFKESEIMSPLKGLFQVIGDRKNEMPKNSYTSSLFKKGVDKICLKVAEEALEVIQAAQKQTKARLAEEAADLVYHLFVLLAEKKLTLLDIEKEIKKRSEI